MQKPLSAVGNILQKWSFFIKLIYSSSVISLKWQLIGNLHCNLSESTEFKYTSLKKMIILEENFKWHSEAFASELFICFQLTTKSTMLSFCMYIWQSFQVASAFALSTEREPLYYSCLNIIVGLVHLLHRLIAVHVIEDTVSQFFMGP